MILVDTSVWVDHFRQAEPHLARLLIARSVRMHPAVVGELAVGNLSGRASVLADLRALPQAREATHDEVLALIDAHRLFGRGIGYLDMHLLAAAITNGDRI